MSLNRMLAQLAEQARASGDAVSAGVEFQAGPNETEQRQYRAIIVVAEIRRPLLTLAKVLPLN
jgi:hypothetical protein